MGAPSPGRGFGTHSCNPPAFKRNEIPAFAGMTGGFRGEGREEPGLTLADIRETRAMIAPYVSVTPVHDWRGREIEGLLAAGTRVNLKLELFQQGGTFKARGAISKMLRLSEEERARGICAVSAGNHAIAAAYAAAALGSTAKVVMMGSANPARGAARSEERRGGQEGRSRWSPYH